MSEFFDGLFMSASPLILASVGALFSDLAGVLAVFVEGFMNAGAFFGWVATMKTGSVFLGLTICSWSAALAGWALARFVRKTGANPFIAGIAVNIAAAGLTDSLSMLWFGTKGVLRNQGVALPGRIAIPVIKDIPFFGPMLSGHMPAVYISWLTVVIAALYLNKTSWGLRLKASGLAPEAAKERGLRPGLYWEISWAAAAFCAALAGAGLSFRVGAYTPGGVAGRGWISVAAVYLGFRTTSGVFAAALVFALAERISNSLQGLSGVSATAMLGLPHALALTLFAVSHWIGKRRGLR